MDDRTDATVVEIQVDHLGKVWVNVDGKCALRIGKARFVLMSERQEPNRLVWQDWPRPGDKMEFRGANGYAHELEGAKKVFEVGKEYVVTGCSVGDWSHSVTFEGIASSWNGVMFELQMPQQEVEVPPKPHMGTIDRWHKSSLKTTEGHYRISGEMSRFNGDLGTTSTVIKHEGNEIETLSSRYTLLRPHPGWGG